MAHNWKSWIKAFELYETATELEKKSDKIRHATFLHVAGPAAQQISGTFSFASDEIGKIAPLKARFAEYCEPRKNITVTRYMFNSRNQKPGESFGTYLTELRRLAQDCEFGSLANDLLKDRVVCGLADNGLREKLLQTENLDLKKCLDICTIAEASTHQMSQLSQGSQRPEHVDHVQATPRHRRRHPDDRDRPPAKNRSSTGIEYDNDNADVCVNCTYQHRYRTCPAAGQRCRNCNNIGHFAMSTRCPKARSRHDEALRRRDRQDRPLQRDLKEIEIDSETENTPRYYDDFKDLYIDLVVDEIDGAMEWQQRCVINDVDVDFKLDSGAQVNVLPEELFRHTGLSLEKSSVVLRSYSGHAIRPIGQTTGQISLGKDRYTLSFQVVSGNVKPILGASACEKMCLLTRNEVVNGVSASAAIPNTNNPEKQAAPPCQTAVHETRALTDPSPPGDAAAKPSQNAPDVVSEYNDLFEGLGTLRRHRYSITLRDDVEPVRCPPRTIPYKIRDKVKAELDRMEKIGVITRVDQPTDWVSAMTVVNKPDGRVRICLDPRGLNKAIKREHYPMPTFDQIVARMPGARVFSKFDATSGYWQLPLTGDSALLTTFATPFGRYCYRVLPFGISSASEIWQRAMADEFEHLEGVAVLADDILVWGTSVPQHDDRLRALLDKVRESGLRLNRAKSVIRTDSVEYVGHIITGDGVTPSHERVKVVNEMPDPTNKTELETFLGMVTYMGKFIPNLSELTAPLRQLLQKGIAWHWANDQVAAVRRIKQAITSAPVLRFYEPSRPVSMATDASNHGFGAVLMQDEQPVAYGSRRVNSAEANYAPIEKEMCAIVYGCKKFHDYIYGQRTVVYTDHKPLIGIFGKELHKLSPRLQRMRMQLLRYDLQLHWKPGKEMFVPDALSRILPRNPDHDVDTVPCSVNVYTVDCVMHMSERRLDQFQTETDRDPVLQKVRAFIRSGWPEQKGDIPCDIRPFHSFRDDLVEVDGLILRENRLVVPQSLQRDMLNVLHEAHLGIVKLKQRARNLFFWPGMNAQIEDKVSRCSICQAIRKKQQSEPMLTHPIPDRPWSKLGVDAFHLDGKNYLLMVDYHSKFPEIQELREMTAHHVIEAMKDVFSRQGTPDEVVTDNARQFDCEGFRQFAREWEFSHHTSSPTYPQSNGQAERCVQTIKTLMKKAKRDNRDPRYALLEYRNSPIDGMSGLTPAQLLNGRLLRSKVPTPQSLLKPNHVPPMQAQLQARQQQQRRYFDMRASRAPLPPLQRGQHVTFRGNDDTWRRGQVLHEHDQPRSYVIKTEGRIMRRNRKDVRPMPDEQPISAAYSPCGSPPTNQPSATHREQTQPYGGTFLTTPVTTRSGRVSKPPERLQM